MADIDHRFISVFRPYIAKYINQVDTGASSQNLRLFVDEQNRLNHQGYFMFKIKKTFY